MNIHNHSIWPPPGASDVNSAANAARHGAILQQSVRTARVVTTDRPANDSPFPVINLMDKG